MASPWSLDGVGPEERTEGDVGACGAGSARHVGGAPIVATAALLLCRASKWGF